MKGGAVASLAAAFTDFRTNGRGDDAAALTYYAVLASGPFLVAIIAAVGLFGRDPQTSDAILDWIGEVGPASATDTFRGTIENLVRDKRSAGTLLGVGVAGALWTASGWLDAFCRVVNDVHGVADQRRFAVRRAVQLGVTLAVAVGVAILAVAAIVARSIVLEPVAAVGGGDLALTIWAALRWAFAAGLAVSVLTTLLHFAPARAHPSWSTSLIGATVAVVTWGIASTGFGLYVSHFGSYNATYGALGAVIVFLVWLWVTHVALIVGAAVDAALVRERQRESPPHLADRRAAGAHPGSADPPEGPIPS